MNQHKLSTALTNQADHKQADTKVIIDRSLSKNLPDNANDNEVPDYDHRKPGLDAAPLKTLATLELPDNYGSTASSPDLHEHADLSHDALAVLLGQQSWDEDARFVAVRSKWFFWDEISWRVDDKRLHMTKVRDFLRSQASELQNIANHQSASLPRNEAKQLRSGARKQAKILRSAPTVSAVETLARSNPASAAGTSDFDIDLKIIGTPSGTVDLQTGLLRPAQRSDMISKVTAVGPAPIGSRPALWLKFLHEIFKGDQEIISFMQRAAGYALTGLTTEHKMLFLYGTGRNGKGTFLNTLHWLLHDYGRRGPATVFLASANHQHPTAIAGLQSARLVIGSELPNGQIWDEAVIKDLTGGDRMTARLMRTDYFDFDPQMTLMIAGNNMPTLQTVDEAIRSRIVLVPFNVTIPPERRDQDLSEKLKAEGPEILRWAIDGAVEWFDRGLDVPECIRAASAEYHDGEDILGEFLTEETISDTNTFTFTSDILGRLNSWLDRHCQKNWTSKALSMELKKRRYPESRKSTGRGFLGFRLRVQ